MDDRYSAGFATYQGVHSKGYNQVESLVPTYGNVLPTPKGSAVVERSTRPRRVVDRFTVKRGSRAARGDRTASRFGNTVLLGNVVVGDHPITVISFE